MNPCPCGYSGSATHECTCSPSQINKYMSRISGPLLDRLDEQGNFEDLKSDDVTAESSADVKKRVDKARAVQTARFIDTDVHCNAQMTSAMIKRYCALDAAGEKILSSAFDKLGMSARAYTR